MCGHACKTHTPFDLECGSLRPQVEIVNIFSTCTLNTESPVKDKRSMQVNRDERVQEAGLCHLQQEAPLTAHYYALGFYRILAGIFLL